MTQRSADVGAKIDKAIDALSTAPLTRTWSHALALVAEATGGWGCCLTSASPRKGLLASATGGVSEDMIRAGVAAGGIDPDNNRRMGAMRSIAPMEIGTDAHIADFDAWKASRYFNEFILRIDAAHSIFSKLTSSYDEVTNIIIWRSATQGPPSDAHLACFSRLLPAVSQAFAVQKELDRRALNFAARTWDHSNTPAFYCDAHLRVLAMSHAGERAATQSSIFDIRRGHLRLAVDQQQRRLSRAVASACRLYRADLRQITVEARDANNAARGVFSVAPVNSEQGEAFLSPAALVLLLSESHEKLDEASRAIRLTNAEENIARELLKGSTTRQIAEFRNSSISTVQTQIKVMNQRLSVRHRAELLARLRDILGDK